MGNSQNRCTAQSKQSGKRCKRLPSIGREVCAMHGGKSPKGFASASYKHGNRSKYLNHLPESKRLRFDRNADAPDTPSVTEELNLARLHLQEVLELLGDSTLFDNWQSIRSWITTLKEQIFNPKLDKEGNPIGKNPAEIFDVLELLFVKNSQALSTWARVHDLNERIRKLEESNSKIHLQNLEAEQERSNLVPKEIFGRFVMEVGETYKLSPELIRKQQMDALDAAFQRLPGAIREPKQLTA